MPTEIYRSPWFNLDGYLACTVKFDDGTKKTVLQHREVMETKLGRKLDRNELVHHKKRGDKRNNNTENLEVLSRSAHGVEHGKDRVVDPIQLTCCLCDAPFERIARHERHNRKQSKKGPFCSKSCAGKWSRQQQLGSGMKNLRSRRPTGRAV